MKPSMEDRIQALFDDWELIFIDLHDLCLDNPAEVSSFLTFIVLDPLEEWLAAEQQKHGFSDSFCSGSHLLQAAKNLCSQKIDFLEGAWAINEARLQWQHDLSFAIKQRSAPFLSAGKLQKRDPLSRVMLSTLKDFCKKHGREPSAQELWDAIPEGGPIQEKDDEDSIIYHTKNNSREASTTFKAFQNRYTQIKKNLN